MESFTRSGLHFPVRDTVPAGTRNGTVVLLHGFPQGPSSWDAVVPLLVEAGHRVVVPTLRGYAPSARPNGVAAYAAVELDDDLAALIGGIGDGPVHLVGHDWGAIIAWSFAASHPDLLRSVTGVSVPPLKAFLQGLQNPRQLKSSWYVGFFQVPGLVERAVSSGFGRSRLIAALTASGQTEERAARDIDALLTSEGGLTAAVNYYRAIRLSRGKHRGDITAPAMFVCSTGDTAITSAATRSAARSTSGAYRSATLLGVSHWIPEEAPGELAALVLDHVGGSRQRSLQR